MRQRVCKTKIIASILVIAALLVTAISPITSAAASFNTEDKVKNALYAVAAYDCINQGYLQATAIGAERDTILRFANTSSVTIGQWLGDQNGSISCSEALKKTLGNGKITASMLNQGQIFNGVYAQSASGEQQIQCNYWIINSEASGLQDRSYSWPQGYIMGEGGEIIDKRSHGVIQVVFNEDGPLRLVGATDDIDVSYTLDYMKNNMIIDWSRPELICSTLVAGTEVYPTGQISSDITSTTINTYEPILTSTDSNPFNEWGIHVDDSYRAWFAAGSGATHSLTSVPSSGLELTSDAKTKLLSNISTIYLNGATNVEGLISSSADAKYILYGRYLFNGDNKGAFACGGTTISKDDPDFADLLSRTDYWDASQSYIAEVQAYKDSVVSSKSTFRTKFGGDGLLSPGEEKFISFPGVAGNCKTLALEFNNVNASSAMAKLAVKDFMNVSTIESLPEVNTPGTTDPGSSGGTVGALDGCFSNAGALGWILCPVLKLASAATNGIYNMIVENYLSVKSETITSDALQGSWRTFQGYANILFAILLVFVILSQVTGIGLSNYGIKKVLPRLIITIVLVNLSYIMCALAVDLSNIVGVGLNDLFSGMDAGGFVASELNIGTMVINSVEGIGLTALAIGAGSATIPILAEAWPNLMLVLFLAVISILISIVFFFILLVVRQAAIIILVVVAPVAVVCYALPNTQKLFDRWLKVFSSLLLVFPICGAVMGGCNYASRLLLSAGGNNGLLYYIIVMVLGVVPLFFIPTILRTSMSALGNFGRSLANAGSRFSRWTNRAITGSRAYQDRQQEAQREGNMRRNSRIAQSVNSNQRYRDLQRRVDAGETLTGRDRRDYERFRLRRARALAGNRKIYNEDNMAEATSRGEDYASIGQNDPRRVASILQYRGRDTEDLSHGYTTMWQNNGTAGSEVKLQAELDSALADLEADENNQDAQARFKAAVRKMSTSDGGRERLEQSINKRIKALGDSGTDSNNGLQWAANMALDGPNAKEFKKIAPSLFNTLSRVAEGGTANAYSGMAANLETDGSLSVTADDKLYTEGIDRMSALALPEIDDRDFKRYISGLKNNKIRGADRAKLIGSAVDALNDPHIKIKPKVAKFVHQIANMRYEQNTSDADLHGASFDAVNDADATAMASAGSSELDRIAQGFKEGVIAQDDPSGSGEYSDVLNVIQKTLETARLNGGMVNGVELSGGDASRMLKILKANGRALTDASGATLTDADYSPLMRIKHSRASYSGNWRQATAADLIAPSVPGLKEGDWVEVHDINTNDHVKRILKPEEVKEIQAVKDFNVRQRMKESADNGTPTDPSSP